jgi:protein-S-isoprenylcysteine O-methyltransferase Ste14
MKSKFLFKTLITTIIFSVILFLSAGKIHYFQGWIFLVTNIITGLMNFWTIKNNKELMNERSKVGKNAKSWDKKILGISAFIYILNIVLAGIDSGRFQWSPKFHWSIYVLGVIILIIGQVIFLAARSQNKYFSSVVRIQTDRGHNLCDTGLYKIVRHPGYLGMTISLSGIPLITGSLWCITTTFIAIVLLFVRTYLEDKTLIAELSGYSQYTHKTKYRLIPEIW